MAVNNVLNTGAAISLGGTLTTAGAVTFSGAYPTTFTITGSTSITLPTSGTLALAGANADITSMTGLTGTLGAPTAVIDPSGNTIIKFSHFPSAVNYIGIINASTTNPPEIFSGGTDTNIGMLISTQATGQFTFSSGNASPFIIESGTSGQHSTTFAMANTNASQTVTFPDATGNICLNLGGGSLNGTPKFSVYCGNAQNINSGSFTKVVLNTKTFDTNTYFDATTNYRFTPLIAGYYLITVAGGFTFGVGDTAVDWAIDIYKNGSAYAQIETRNTIASANENLSISRVINFNGSTDYVELYLYQASGGARAVIATATGTFMDGSLLV